MRNLMKVIFMALLIVMVAAACSSNSKDQASETSQSTAAPQATAGAASAEPAKPADPPTEIHALEILWGNLPTPKSQNKAWQDVEKRANIKLTIDLVPHDGFDDKEALILTDMSDYDLILHNWDRDLNFNSLVEQGAFKDITPFLKGMDNLNAMGQDLWDSTAVGGKNYSIPRATSSKIGGDCCFVVRKDWLDKYNLSVPKTLDELTNVLRVFKEKDPAGNGKTVPMSGWVGSADKMIGGTEPIAYGMGKPNEYVIQDGKILFDFELPYYTDYLNWMKMAWSEELFDHDAPIMIESQYIDKFLTGVVGVFTKDFGYPTSKNIKTFQSVDPNANLVPIPFVTSAGHPDLVQSSSGYYGMWVIPSHVSDEKAQKIVEYLNWSASVENQTVGRYGVQGVHYTSIDADRKIIRNDEQTKANDADIPSIFYLMIGYHPELRIFDRDDQAINKELTDLWASYQTKTAPYQMANADSQTMVQNPDGLKPIYAAAMKYVMGEGTLDDVQKQVTVWNKEYGDKIKHEIMDAKK